MTPDHDCRSHELTFITSMGDHISIIYCREGRHLMAAATRKVILFATSRFERKVYSHPVAVFPSETAARTYVMFLRLAHRAQDTSAVVALDPATHLTEDGALITDTKWSILEVPYSPSPTLADEDGETSAEAAAA